MRIALVCPYAWDRVGGVQSHVRSLARVLEGRGHEVCVLAPQAGRDEAVSGEVTLVGRAVGIPANGSVAPLSFGPLAAAGVRRALKAFDPDVLHLHEPLIPSLSLLALWNHPAPAVGTFHASADGSFGYRAARPVLKRAAAKLSVRTAVSDAARDLVSRYFPGDYVLTPNGVEAKRFASAEPLDLGPGRHILFLSRIEPRKGLDVLIRATSLLQDLDVRLLVAGSGPEERSCRELALELGVEVRFAGRVSEEDLPRLYRSADVFCAPGLGGESFGIVLVEAMAAGTAVVCSDLPGFRAVASGAAELAPPGDARGLAEGLRNVLTDDARLEEMRAMSKRLGGMYDWGRLAAGVESVYQTAAGGVKQ